MISAQEAVTDLSCDSPHAVDATVAPPRDTAPFTVRLRGLTPWRSGAEPTFALHLTTLEGTEREPVQVRWDVPVDETIFTEGGDALLRARLPTARAWALGLTTLAPTSRASNAPRSVDQVLLVTGGEIRADEALTLDVFLSDETLRGAMAWDASGPPGVEEVEIVQGVPFGELVVEVTTWRGPVAGPMILPLVRRVPDDPVIGVRGVFHYGPAGRCASRSVGMAGVLAEASPGEVADTAARVGDVLTFRPPFPPPPVLEMPLGPTPAWSLSSFPLEGVTLRFAWADERVSWRGQGRTGLGACRQVELAWPEGLAPRQGELSGEVAWEAGDRWGRCEVGAR